MVRYLSLLLFIGLAWGQETVTDIDGNVYQTVQIGDQLWMAENLKVTHYNNGDEIQYVQSESSEPNVWANLSTGAYGYYNDDLSHQEIYGNLYNWYAVETGNLAPEGWHVPTDDEIKQLEMYLGMSQEEADGTGHRGTNEGSKLAGMADLWNDGNLVNNPEFGTSGFNLLPGGYRISYGGYYDSMGLVGYFWSSTENSSNYAWNRVLYYYSSDIDRYDYHKKFGFSVRCVRNAQAETIHVPQDYPTIQAGIDAASEGDTVLVSAGTYVENINYNGKNIAVIGEDWETTIIDGNEDGTVVTFENSEDSTTVLSGFTITNGKGHYGGGIRIYESSPNLTKLTIKNNRADLSANLGNLSKGGGIYCFGSPIISNVLIVENFAYFGGGIVTSGWHNPILSNVTIVDNDGGGIVSIDAGYEYATEFFTQLHQSIVWGNTPNQIEVLYGADGGSIQISYSNIQGGENEIIIDGGYLYWLEGNIDADPIFCNVDSTDFTLAENSPCVGTGENGSNMGAFGVGCGPYNFSPTEFSLSTPSNNAQITIDDSNMNDGFITFSWDESSDENGDSLVYLMHATSTEIGDFSLDTNVTYIDISYMDLIENMTENNTTFATIEWTVDVTDGIDTVTADNAPFSFNVDGSDALSSLVEKLIPEVFALHQNYPNPFNPVTTLQYDLPEDALVNITIYDMMGRQVKTLINGSQTAGYKTIQWDATNNFGEPVSAGLYLYTIEAGEFRQTKKMVLLK